MEEYFEDSSLEDVSLSDWERGKIKIGDEVIRELKKSGISEKEVYEQWQLFRMKMDELDETQNLEMLKKISKEFLE